MASEISLPVSLPFPITITKLLVEPGDQLERSTPLFYYSYKVRPPGGGKAEIRYGTLESHVEGTLDTWGVDPNDVVTKDYGPVMLVNEPCKHGLQIGGLCANCGKDMTEMDYMTLANTQRATIQMDYNAGGPLLSAEEAAKIEQQSMQTLLKQRKLTLVVDLDQTILHTTMDPTVGEWMHEREEVKRGNKVVSPEDKNPNWPALEDVASFQLIDDLKALGVHRSQAPYYYVKPRPGLKKFMDTMSTMYEMHVYTMGTRTYADAICKALDPNGTWFGERILTRSESGSDRMKNLKRLFPHDQTMVVIIDDRADVWDWSPNLVKVVPFEFFVGTGDINSATLPKQKSIVPEETKPKEQQSSQTKDEDSMDIQEQRQREEEEEREKIQAQKAKQVERLIDEQPLARAQEQLDAVDEQKMEEDVRSKTPPGEPPTASPKKVHHTAVLKNSDRELVRVEDILTEIHHTFYKTVDKRKKEMGGKRSSASIDEPDVARIIPARMSETFGGYHFAFSGLIPLNENPERADIWRTAKSFGAACHRSVHPQLTHLIAAQLGTQKIDQARKAKNIHIVGVKWFSECVSQWRRLPEGPYLLIDPNKPQSPRRNGSQRTTPARPASPRQSAAPSRSTTPPDPGTITGDVHLDGVNWNDVEREVAEAMGDDEEDDDDDEATTDEDDEDLNRQGHQRAPTGQTEPLADGRGLKRTRSDASSTSASSSRSSSRAGSLLLSSPSNSRSKRQKLTHQPRQPSLLRSEILQREESVVTESGIEEVPLSQTTEDTVLGDRDDFEDEDDFLAEAMGQEPSVSSRDPYSDADIDTSSSES